MPLNPTTLDLTELSDAQLGEILNDWISGDYVPDGPFRITLLTEIAGRLFEGSEQ